MLNQGGITRAFATGRQRKANIELQSLFGKKRVEVEELGEQIYVGKAL